MTQREWLDKLSDLVGQLDDLGTEVPAGVPDWVTADVSHAVNMLYSTLGGVSDEDEEGDDA